MARAHNALTGRFGTHSLPSKDKYGIITMGTHLDRDWMGRRPANEGGSSPLINWGPGGGLAYTPATHIGSLLSHQLLSVSPVPLILCQQRPPLSQVLSSPITRFYWDCQSQPRWSQRRRACDPRGPIGVLTAGFVIIYQRKNLVSFFPEVK